MTGCKAGFGTLKYKDGSVYTGHFIEGLKHGQGMQRNRDGSIYDGMWENDLMNGEGLLTLADQTKIKTTFVFGRKHGKGVVTSAGGDQYNCVYYHDMENLLERSSSRCWDCAWLNIFLTLCLLVSIFFGVYVERRVFIATGVCYLIILCETCCSLTSSYLGNVMPPGQLTQYLVNLGALPPHIKYWIQNYHYEERTYTANGRTQTKKVRVNTHQATEYFAWGDCVDKSPEPDSVEIIKNFKLTRV